MPGTALGIPDDLSHGPLDDGRARMDYMRGCFRGYADWPFQATDAFLPWRAMMERIGRNEPESILVWSGDNVSEATFLAMACWWLRTRSEPLLRVAVPGTDDRYHVALQSPAELADLFTSAQVLTESERADLSEEFVRIRSETGLLRRWNRGQILGAPLERYDPQLIACCPTDWTPAARVVGAAMGRCDPRNRMSDLFFSSRLQVLIDAGRVEALGRRDRLREYAVRRAES